MRNDQCRGKSYQPEPKASQITLTKTLIILHITKTESIIALLHIVSLFPRAIDEFRLRRA